MQIQAEIEGNGAPQTSLGVGVQHPAGSGSGSGSEHELICKTRGMVEALTVQIQSSATAAEESKLERLLDLCDRLNGGLDTLTSRASRRSRLRGLGLRIDGLHVTDAGSGAGAGAGTDANGETTVHENENLPLTPRVDKGKGRAEPEPEEPEKVLSPTFMITESEDEDEDDHRYLDVEEGEEVHVQATSPTDRYVRFHHIKGGAMFISIWSMADVDVDVCV